MSELELKNTIGGATTFSGTLINSISKLINTVLDLGRVVGSAIRYRTSGKTCPLK